MGSMHCFPDQYNLLTSDIAYIVMHLYIAFFQQREENSRMSLNLGHTPASDERQNTKSYVQKLISTFY